MSQSTMSRILGGIVALGSGIAGGMTLGPAGAIAGGLIGVIQWFAGWYHPKADNSVTK